QIEKVVLVAATMGLLNRCLDTLGMVLEGPLLAMARARLAETGWEEALVFQEESDASLLANAAPPPPPLSAWGLVRAMFGALSFASPHLSACSPRLRRQKAKARAALGF